MDDVRRCPRCNDVWPASAPRCLSCRYASDGTGPRPSVGNALIFGLAVAAGLGFVLFHNMRRKQEHPPVPSVSQPKDAPAADPAKPPKAHACTLTSTDLDRMFGDAKVAALDACKASNARLQLGIANGGQVVSLEGSIPDETRRCIAAALGVSLPSTTEPVMVCSYQLK